MRHKLTLVSAGTVAGTTLGAGIFALPYLAKVSGLVPTIAFLVALSAVVIYAHVLYWRVLQQRAPGTHLLELVRQYAGPLAAKGTFVATILGLILTVSAYLTLGTTFIQGLTGMPHAYATLLFWALCSIPLAFQLKRFIGIELFATGFMSALLVILVATVPIRLSAFPLVNWSYAFLPFGPILFALAGWTAVEPALALVRGERGHRYRALGLGTVSVAFAYLLFALAFGSNGQPVTPDTLSGVLHLPFWQVGILLVFGLAAILTSYLPMNLELKHAFQRGLKWPKSLAFSVALFLPYFLVLAGFDSFLTGVELVGGIFLAAQYVAILQVCRHALGLKGWNRFAADGLSAVFGIAALAHVLNFVAPLLGLR